MAAFGTTKAINEADALRDQRLKELQTKYEYEAEAEYDNKVAAMNKDTDPLNIEPPIEIDNSLSPLNPEAPNNKIIPVSPASGAGDGKSSRIQPES